MRESCTIFILKDGDPRNLSEDNILFWGKVTLLDERDEQMSTGRELVMKLVRDGELDKPFRCRIIKTEKGAIFAMSAE